MTKSTPVPSRAEALAQREWRVVDAEGRALGRVASQVATLLRGKHKATFSPHVDAGDFVVVLNASKVRLSGSKADDKVLYRHSEYPGGIRAASSGRLREDNPERLVRAAVAGMLPKNRLSRRLITKLRVYPGAQHPHAAQKAAPVPARD
jgi:large subunit ribosomal protein L13